jgi:hypothetical protein
MEPTSQRPSGRVVAFSFDGPFVKEPPTSWRTDLLSVLSSFEGDVASDDVIVATGELVSNGVEHGGGVVRLHVDGRGGVVTVEVEDAQPTMDAPTVSRAGERGRGLDIVRDLADEWGWTPTVSGKTVWARFSRRHDTGEAS